MRKFLLLLIGVTFLCVNNSNAQNNNPQGGQQKIEFRILKGGHHSSGTSGEHHAPYMRPYIMLVKNNKSDDLGNVEISFKDPIIIPDRENTGNGYKIYTYNTGSVEMMILPVRKF